MPFVSSDALKQLLSVLDEIEIVVQSGSFESNVKDIAAVVAGLLNAVKIVVGELHNPTTAGEELHTPAPDAALHGVG